MNKPVCSGMGWHNSWYYDYGIYQMTERDVFIGIIRENAEQKLQLLFIFPPFSILPLVYTAAYSTATRSSYFRPLILFLISLTHGFFDSLGGLDHHHHIGTWTLYLQQFYRAYTYIITVRCVLLYNNIR